MTPRDTQELVEEVRHGLAYRSDADDVKEADAALTELAERLEAAERKWQLAATDALERRPAQEVLNWKERAETAERELASINAAALLLHKRVEELEAEVASNQRALELQRSAWGRNIREREAAEAQLAERDKRIEEAQVLLMEGAALVLARDKRIEGLRGVLTEIAGYECEPHDDDIIEAHIAAAYNDLAKIARAALADPVVDSATQTPVTAEDEDRVVKAALKREGVVVPGWDDGTWDQLC